MITIQEGHWTELGKISVSAQEMWGIGQGLVENIGKEAGEVALEKIHEWERSGFPTKPVKRGKRGKLKQMLEIQKPGVWYAELERADGGYADARLRVVSTNPIGHNSTIHAENDTHNLKEPSLRKGFAMPLEPPFLPTDYNVALEARCPYQPEDEIDVGNSRIKIPITKWLEYRDEWKVTHLYTNHLL